MFNETIQQVQVLSGGFALLVLFFGLLWWLLCIVLFFKVWGMTNDVFKMKELMKEWLDIEHPVTERDDRTSDIDNK